MTEAELIKFLIALRDNCGNKRKVEWYDGLIEDIGMNYRITKESKHPVESNDMLEEAKKLWQNGNKLEAVKLMCQSGYRLKDAKNYCDENFGLLPNLPKSTENLSKIKDKDEQLNEVRGNEDKSLYETQICLQTLINRVRQAVNKKELILSPPFQKAFDDALYIIKKYSTPSDAFRIVQSEREEPISEDELILKMANCQGLKFSTIHSLKDSPYAYDSAKSRAKIAQQYTNSKLEEIEKWIDEVIKEQHYEIAIAAFDEVKEKIQSLKEK